MPRVSPWADSTPIPALRRDTKTFTCPRTGYALEITLEALDELGIGRANDLFEAWCAVYVKPPNGKAPSRLSLPVVPAQAVSVPRHLLRQVALLQAMDVEAGDAPWGLPEWVGVALKHAELWQEVSEWANQLNGPVPPNDSGVATEASSAPPSAPSTPTPKG